MNTFSRNQRTSKDRNLSCEPDCYGQVTPRFVVCRQPAKPKTAAYEAVCGRRAGRELKPIRAQRAAAQARIGERVHIPLRPYQMAVFSDRSSGILILHWARQIGKSFALAAWAVDRLLTRPGRLVTVLSNSRENGAEFVSKCAQVCQLNGTAFTTKDESKGVLFQNMQKEVRITVGGKTGRIKVLAANPRTARGFSGDLILDEFAFHEDSNAIWEAAEPILASNADFRCRIASTGNGRHNLFYRMTDKAVGRIGWKPRKEQNIQHSTFNAQHSMGTERPADSETAADKKENIQQPTFNIQHSIENNPVGSDSPKLGVECSMLNVECLPSSTTANNQAEKEENIQQPTFNAQHRTEEEKLDGVLEETGIARSKAGFLVSRITRTEAHEMGVPIFDANTRQAITPAEARAQALDKRAYDQNYECSFADENLTLLTHELIDAAEHNDVGFICEQDWEHVISESDVQSPRSNVTPLDFLREANGYLFVGFDVARKGDLSVLTVIEDLHGMKFVRAILRMQDLRLPEQQRRLGEVCKLPRFRRAAIDMTGLGLGLFEYAQQEFGSGRIYGINFATSVPATRAIRIEGRTRERVRVTEALALELLKVYEDRRIQHPEDVKLREDLRKPEKITSPGGRVSIAATRDEAGHADHFWSFALAIEAACHGGGGASMTVPLLKRRRYLL